MTAALVSLPAVLLVASSGKSTGSDSSVTFIIFLVVIGLVGYFLLLRPQQQRARRQRQQQSDISVGDEILTVGGIVGTVLEIDDERVTIITGLDQSGARGVDGTGPGVQPTQLVLVRNAIARKIEPTVPSQPDEPGGTASSGHPGYGGMPSIGDDDRQGGLRGGVGDDADDQERTDGGSGEGRAP